jgi:hypothetical protein
MQAMCSSEMSADFQRTTRPYIPEDRTLYNHRCENLRSYMKRILVLLVSYTQPKATYKYFTRSNSVHLSFKLNGSRWTQIADGDVHDKGV